MLLPTSRLCYTSQSSSLPSSSRYASSPQKPTCTLFFFFFFFFTLTQPSFPPHTPCSNYYCSNSRYLLSRRKHSLLPAPPSSPHLSSSLACHAKRPSSKKGKGGKADDAEELASQAFRALGAMGSNTGTCSACGNTQQRRTCALCI